MDNPSTKLIPPTTAERLWTVHDVAAYLGVPVTTLYRWRTLGQGPTGRRVGKHLRYRAADVIAWVDQLDTETPAAAGL